MLADSTLYFVRYIDVYKGKNAGNIDIHERAYNIPTKIKVVVNGIIGSGVGNDHDVARKIFLDHHYACPKLRAIYEEELNVLVGGRWHMSERLPRKRRLSYSTKGV